jgi:long-chain acyl-CoA synthetase
MKQTLLITGANGMIGSELTKKLVQESLYDRIVALVHESRNNLPDQTKSFQVLKCDLTKSNLGLDLKEYSLLSKEVTAIIHSAANTKFSLPISRARKINYQGTVNICRFAQKCPRLEKFAFISTAYVAGKRTGLIKESDLHHNKGFVNTYEQSKYEAETFVEGLKNKLPINIYRLSTVVGKSEDGTVTNFNAVHLALKLYYHNLAPFIPANKTSFVDFVPLEFVVDSIYYIFNKRFQPGLNFHIVSGRENSLTVKDLINQTYEIFTHFNSGWLRNSIEKPSLVDIPTFRLISKSANELSNKVLIQVIRSIETFAPQLLYPKDFDHSHADKELINANIEVVPLDQYYHKIVEYCLKTNWGRKPYSSPN